MACAGGCSWRYLGRDNVSDGDALAVGCEQPYRLICGGCASTRLARCGKASSRACAPCSARSRSRVERVARSGMALGREVVGIEGLFLTLTAPSWVEHRLPDGRPCRCTGSRGAARIRPARDLDEWNATAGNRWNRLCQELRRELGVKVEYFKAAETQRRGALHFHVMLRDPEGRPLRLSVRKARELAIRYGFGHAVDVQPLVDHHARYVAKYVTKAATERQDVPWRGWARTERVDKSTGEVRTGRRMVYRATYRTWSCSRAWGRSMASVRASQAHHEVCLERLPSWARYEPRRAWVHDAGTLGVPDRPPGG